METAGNNATARWVGPLAGASVAAMSRLIFAPKAGLVKVSRRCMQIHGVAPEGIWK